MHVIMRLMLNLSVLFFSSLSLSAEYYVSVKGSDKNSGGISDPYRTVQKAIDSMKSGDTCIIREGTYRESVVISNLKGGLSIKAHNNEKVIFDGRELLSDELIHENENVFYFNEKVDSKQFFYGNSMLSIAKWPNIPFKDSFDISLWAKAGMKSKYGAIDLSEYSQFKYPEGKFELILNGAHQYYSWKVSGNSNNTIPGILTYSKNLDGIGKYGNDDEAWKDDRFYLQNNLVFLDDNLEYFNDYDEGKLYVYLDESQRDNTYRFSYKVRDFAFDVKNSEGIFFEGLEFFATTVRMNNCNSCSLVNSTFLYPTFAPSPSSKESTFLKGNGLKILNSRFRFASGTAIKLVGKNNILQNSIVDYSSWYGTLKQPAVELVSQVGEAGSSVRHSLIKNAGSVLVKLGAGKHFIERNEIHSGGKLSKDVALVYGGWSVIEGSVISHNWVYDGYSALGDGICIRGDGLTRGLTIDHNFVWNCGFAGIVIKGDENAVLNNTVMITEDFPYTQFSMLVTTGPEPKKKNSPDGVELIKKQNQNSIFFNNMVREVVTSKSGELVKKSNNYCGNSYPTVSTGYKTVYEFAYSSKDSLGCTKQQGNLSEAATYIGSYNFRQKPWVPGVSTGSDFNF